MLTSGHLLPCRYLMHAVGPVWHGGERGEPQQLASAYRTALALAEGAGCRVVAAPLISTGVFGYLLVEAAAIAVAAAGAAPEPVERVILVAFPRGGGGAAQGHLQLTSPGTGPSAAPPASNFEGARDQESGPGDGLCGSAAAPIPVVGQFEEPRG